MTTHTPGPWYFTTSSPDGLVFSENSKQPREPIVPHFDHRAWTPAEQIANARLIAAAPELLLLAQQAESVFKDMANGNERSCWKEMYQKARDVLAKAEPA